LYVPFCLIYSVTSLDSNFEDDNFAAYVLANALQKPENVTEFLYERAMRTSFTLFNDKTGFIEAQTKDGSWAGQVIHEVGQKVNQTPIGIFQPFL
jgi:putative alpha-1,2-mannosidase